MSYLDTLLADGEDIVLRSRRHWLALVVGAGRAWLLLLLAVVALLLGLVVGPGGVGTVRATAAQALSLAAFGLLLIALLSFLVHVWRWMSDAYVITNRRVLQVEGILTKRAADTSLEKINDAVLRQGLGGRLFGYGDLEVLTASESAIDRFRLLRDAVGFKRTMLNQKHLLERDLAFRPSPPVRVGAGGVGSGAGLRDPGSAAMGQPGNPAAGRGADRDAWLASPPVRATPAQGAVAPASGSGAALSDAFVVTQTLGRLAELRDRGAISEDEYQAKKAELLQRL